MSVRGRGGYLLWPVGGTKRVRGINAVLGFLVGAALEAPAISVFFDQPTTVTGTDSTSGVQTSHVVSSVSIVDLLLVMAALVGFGTLTACLSAARWPVPSISGQASRALRAFRLGLAAGLTAGLTTWLTAWFAFGVIFGSAAGLVATLVVGLAVGLAAGSGLLGDREWVPDAIMISPLNPLQQQFKSGLVILLAAGLTVGTMLALGFGLVLYWLFLLIGVTIGFLPVLAVALLATRAWARFTLGRTLATTRQLLPSRLGHFLRWAQDTGLLRVSGGTYQFRHRELQHRLSHRSPD